jgi:hypothetical protein
MIYYRGKPYWEVKPMDKLLTAREVTKVYGASEYPSLNKISFDVNSEIGRAHV